MVINCDLLALTPYTPSVEVPWESKAIQHFYRRTGFGAKVNEIQNTLVKQPQDFIAQQLQKAISAPIIQRPIWWNWKVSDYTDIDKEATDQVLDMHKAWVNDMRANPMRAKMVLFWHNHFSCQRTVYQCPSYLFQYYEILQKNAFGNFRTFLKEIGLSNAMLVYLNGNINVKSNPNENYARELFELFSLGEANGYTQQDIVEAAKALTGYNGLSEGCAMHTFVPFNFDNTDKTIFGVTANFNHSSLVDLILAERGVECSEYICGKLYKHYVSDEIDTNIVGQLAKTLRDSDWELAAVYRQLFSSNTFFSPSVYGSKIKNPIEYILTIERELNTDVLLSDQYTLTIVHGAGQLGQELFEPPDVSGWPGNRFWINGSSMSLRKEYANLVLGLIFNKKGAVDFVGFVRSLQIQNESDPNEIVQKVANFLLPEGFQTSSELKQAVKVFKGEVPDYYFEQGYWNLDFEFANAQIGLLIQFLMHKPEYQLH